MASVTFKSATCQYPNAPRPSVDRLDLERDPQNDVQISNALEAHQQSLRSNGIRDDTLDELVRERGPKKK